MAQPNFALMWKSFPDHVDYPTLKALHTYIGGRVAVNVGVDMGFPENGNTCAMRMSRALNHGGFPLSIKLIGALGLGKAVLTGGDRLPYLFRVKDLRKYLEAALGVTPVHDDYRNLRDNPSTRTIERLSGMSLWSI